MTARSAGRCETSAGVAPLLAGIERAGLETLDSMRQLVHVRRSAGRTDRVREAVGGRLEAGRDGGTWRLSEPSPPDPPVTIHRAD
jgi:hypothetical protein